MIRKSWNLSAEDCAEVVGFLIAIRFIDVI